MRHFIVAELDHHATAAPPRDWLTTGDAAQLLGLTSEGVRMLVRTRALACQWTVSGLRIFRREDVRRALVARTEAQARSRPAVLASRHLQLLTADREPRQLTLFSRRRTPLELVHSGPGGERSLENPQVKASAVFEDHHASDNQAFVNRKSESAR